MNAVVLYLVLLKATITAFAGLASLVVVRDELVVNRPVLTDKQLNEALVITRSTPGPTGLYVVSVGYFAGGISGGIAGWLAMSTPALLIIPLVHFAGRRVEHPKVKAVLEAVVLTSAGLLLAAAIPLAKAAIVDSLTLVISLVSIGLMLKTKLDTLWIILAAAATAYAGWAVELFLTGLLSVEVVVECRIPCLSCSDWLVQSYVATRIFPKTVILPSRPIFL